MQKKFNVYVAELLVLLDFVALTVVLQLLALRETGALTSWKWGAVLASGALIITVQQLRCTVIRRRSADSSEVFFHERIATCALLIQVLSLLISISQVPTWGHVFVGLYVFCYGPAWTYLHRQWYPVASTEPVTPKADHLITLDTSLADMVVIVRGREAVVLKNEARREERLSVEDLIMRLLEHR